jgi:hypothetical protein
MFQTFISNPCVDVRSVHGRKSRDRQQQTADTAEGAIGDRLAPRRIEFRKRHREIQARNPAQSRHRSIQQLDSTRS